MQSHKRKIIPVLLGADLNAYSVALAFFEAYGVKSHAFARYRCGATENSNFIKTHICSGIDDVRIAVPELLKFAEQNPGCKLFLIPCADWYVDMLESAKEKLMGIYNVHIPEREMFYRLSDKHRFYKEMKRAGIPYPEYEVFYSLNEVTEDNLKKIQYKNSKNHQKK